MVAGAVGVTRNEIAEDHSGFAGENSVDRLPVGAIELGQFKLFQNRAGIAQLSNRGLERLLLLGLRARPFLETHDTKTRRIKGFQAFVDVDMKARKWPAMRIAIARACEQRQRQCDIVDASGKEADVI